MTPTPPRLCITMGDPAGIGPEIVLKALARLAPRVAAGEFSLQVAGSAAVLRATAESLGLTGAETFDIVGLAAGLQPRQEIAVTATRADGSKVTFQ